MKRCPACQRFFPNDKVTCDLCGTEHRPVYLENNDVTDCGQSSKDADDGVFGAFTEWLTIISPNDQCVVCGQSLNLSEQVLAYAQSRTDNGLPVELCYFLEHVRENSTDYYIAQTGWAITLIKCSEEVWDAINERRIDNESVSR